MQFSAVVLALAATVAADVATINTAITNVQKSLADLDTSVKAFQGAQQAADVQQKSAAAQQVITQGAQQVQATQPIALTDAIQLQQTAGGLTTQAMTTVMDLINQKPKFDQAGLSPVVLQQLQAQQQGANTLSQAIVSKVPAAVQNLATQMTGQIASSLNMGIQAFGGQAAPAAAPKPAKF